jgi:hypothetical protein
MIAICPVHHGPANAGAYTKEQMREFKTRSHERVEGSFEWLRRDIILIAGGLTSFDDRIALNVHGNDVIWINRDGKGRGLLNIQVPRPEPNLRITENFWDFRTDVLDFDCPPR